MKKIILFFTLLCINYVFGMHENIDESKYEILNPAIWHNLPKDIIAPIIIVLLHNGDTLEIAINNIKNTRLISKELKQKIDQQIKQMVIGTFTNLQSFTKLAHILANRFKVTTQKVAEKSETDIANKYLELGNRLLIDVCNDSGSEDINSWIEQDADINFSSIDVYGNYMTPLQLAVKYRKFTKIRQLLALGADPTKVGLIYNDSLHTQSEMFIAGLLNQKNNNNKF